MRQRGGTLPGLQPIADMMPAILTPKTIDNDLGLNYMNEDQEWIRKEGEAHTYSRYRTRTDFDMETMVNYGTPEYATAVFDPAMGINRFRTNPSRNTHVARRIRYLD